MPNKTIKDRISDITKKYTIKSDTFETEIFDLVERGSFPDNFCSKCDTRMVFDNSKMRMYCINCGNVNEDKKTSQIAELVKNECGPVASSPKKSIADKVLKLKAKMDGVDANTAMSPEDLALGNNINWV